MCAALLVGPFAFRPAFALSLFPAPVGREVPGLASVIPVLWRAPWSLVWVLHLSDPEPAEAGQGVTTLTCTRTHWAQKAPLTRGLRQLRDEDLFPGSEASERTRSWELRLCGPGSDQDSASSFSGLDPVLWGAWGLNKPLAKPLANHSGQSSWRGKSRPRRRFPWVFSLVLWGTPGCTLKSRSEWTQLPKVLAADGDWLTKYSLWA